MRVNLTCLCPKLHRIELTHRLTGKNISKQYINKEIIGTKISGFCPQCGENTVFRVEDMAPIQIPLKDKYRGVLPDRNDYNH